ncbi:DUF2264 domain-containing protein [Ferruginibacter sp.]|nr:DUF2264 domain-containing protein [Ferruginibacter sp.]
MKKIIISALLFAVVINSIAQKNTRAVWLQYLDKTARPVLTNLANNTLKEKMPLVLSDKVDNKAVRSKVAYLEAFARTLSGIAPWLQLEEGDDSEKKLRNEYRQLSLKALSNAVNPTAKDYMEWKGGQPLVDASFLSLALVRCPWIWQHADTATQRNVKDAFLLTRNTVPVYSNWLLFTAMIETFFCKYNLPYDKVRIDFAVKEFSNHWYTGDGMFADGNKFHLDYYNSYVIQPYLLCIVDELNKKDSSYKNFVPRLNNICKRYAEIQERLINTDGSFPVTGRSITYRGGAFHHLANMALQQQLPQDLTAAQVRCALTAVLKKTMDAPATFNDKGWLNIGLAGWQPGLAEGYINTGSIYLCTQIFLPLGLSPADDFWTKPDAPWTAVKIWSGQDVKADHAVDF